MPRKKALLFFLLLTTVLSASSQHAFKYDNTVYKAVYLNEAFRLMNASPGYLLLDVRSPGEYADTAAHTMMNIGRIRGAVNIDVDSVEGRLDELRKYADKPVFIYCSHSQRSRRISKLLGENGFQQVYNINGGMSLVNEVDNDRFIYKNKMLEVNTAYKNIASTDAIKLIQNTPDLVIIDIRTQNEFDSKDSLQQHNIGHLKNAINIPENVFAEKFDSYKISNKRPVLVYDLYGYNSMDQVDMLRSRGFTEIYNLFEGLNMLITDHALTKNLRDRLIVDAPAWQLLDSKGCIDILKKYPDLVILDTRTADEFNNKANLAYLNLGQIKGAINIPAIGSLEDVIKARDKSTRFLVYGRGEPCSLVSSELVKKGFKQVYQMGRGFYRFVWASANIEDCKEGKQFLINHEGLY